MLITGGAVKSEACLQPVALRVAIKCVRLGNEIVGKVATTLKDPCFLSLRVFGLFGVVRRTLGRCDFQILIRRWYFLL